MTQVLSDAMNKLAKKGLAKNECAVEDCDGVEPRLFTLKPLDPIDHGPTTRVFCAEHRQWGRERNRLAEQIKAELVEKRQELGKEHYDEIQRLSSPDGETPDEILMGEYESVEAYEADQ